MNFTLEHIISLSFLFQCLRITIPYYLPALGATFSEKGGVINIALEGIMLSSAFFTALGTFYTQNIIFGILCGAISGGFLALIHSIASIKYQANQIVSGLAINLFSIGLTRFLCSVIFNSSSNSPRIPGFETLGTPASLTYHLFTIFCLIALIVSYVTIYKTKFGLRLRACGENPLAVYTSGVNVNKIRFTGVLISGFLAGLGGAWLSLNQHNFTDGISGGRGYIALAAMIVGKWNPLGATAACLIFGISESLSIQFQKGFIPDQIIQMIPYLVTIIALTGFIGKTAPPASDGVPFDKSGR